MEDLRANFCRRLLRETLRTTSVSRKPTIERRRRRAFPRERVVVGRLTFGEGSYVVLKW